MKTKIFFAALLTALIFLVQADGAEAQTASLKAQNGFFKTLKKMCGQKFEGATEFPINPDHALVGKRLLMTVATCTDKEIRIPFQVAEDKSRTWILTLTEKGLLFKHDHRHADGTPDKITNYGGMAAAGGTKFIQKFPADAETAVLIPEASTNVWTMQIGKQNKRFMYQLERHGELRYRGYFNLKTPAK